MRVPLADFRGYQQEGADNDHEETCIGSVFLHQSVKFCAKLQNNYQLATENCRIFCTFAAANCKNNIYLIFKVV